MTDEAHARGDDPETSHEAAASITNCPARQVSVYKVVEEFGPLPDFLLNILYKAKVDRGDDLVPQTPQSVRSRRAELVRKGLVHHVGYIKDLPTQRRHRTWSVT